MLVCRALPCTRQGGERKPPPVADEGRSEPNEQGSMGPKATDDHCELRNCGPLNPRGCLNAAMSDSLLDYITSQQGANDRPGRLQSMADRVE